MGWRQNARENGLSSYERKTQKEKRKEYQKYISVIGCIQI